MKLSEKPERQFIFLTICILAAAAIAANFIISEKIKKSFIESRKEPVAHFVSKQIENHLPLNAFLSKDYESSRPYFEKYFTNIDTEDVIRIKVYNKNSDIIYSDEPNLLGKNFSDNKELREALEGEIAVEIKEPLEKENVYEKGYKQLMEIYLPVYYSGESGPQGVVEVYYKLDALNSEIGRLKIFLAVIFILIFLFLFGGLFWIFKNASDKIKVAYKKDSERLQELAKLRNEFVFVAAHELRAPAAAISGFIDLIFEKEGELANETKNNLNKIKSANQHLSELVNDLLSVARAESEKIKITVSPQEIIKIVSIVIEELSPLAARNKISIEYDPSIKLPFVLANEKALKEIITNLIMNAIKYSKENGKVFIYHEMNGEFLATHIKDTGLGIKKEDESRIFQKFWRSKNVITLGISGTGLGLFITKELVERMGGKIWFKSKEGEGSIFSFELPISLE